MSAHYHPPAAESQHKSHHFEVIEKDDPDRVWKGFVVGLCLHLLQPLMWWFTEDFSFRWRPEMTFFTQALYLVPASFLIYRIWGIRAFRGIYLLMLLTITAMFSFFGTLFLIGLVEGQMF